MSGTQFSFCLLFICLYKCRHLLDSGEISVRDLGKGKGRGIRPYSLLRPLLMAIIGFISWGRAHPNGLHELMQVIVCERSGRQLTPPMVSSQRLTTGFFLLFCLRTGVRLPGSSPNAEMRLVQFFSSLNQGRCVLADYPLSKRRDACLTIIVRS